MEIESGCRIKKVNFHKIKVHVEPRPKQVEFKTNLSARRD